VDLDPFLEELRIFEIEGERGEIKATLLHIGVVAFETVFFEERRECLRRGSKGGDGKDEKGGRYSHGDL
jgi:hypothetical protein